MTLTAVVPPFPLFTDKAGAPVDAGFVYIGVADMNPVSNPIAVYWDAALTIPASQPIRTTGGYPSNNGAPGVLFSASDYSITVKDKNGVQLLTLPRGARAGLGSIVLVATESLTAQAGAFIRLEDGAELDIGTATGTGVLVKVASNARVARRGSPLTGGNWVPNEDGVQSLGIVGRLWNAFLAVVTANEVDGAVNYSKTSDPVPTTDKMLVSANQLGALVVCGTVSAAGVVSTRHRNITSATWVGTGVCEVLLDRAIADDSVPVPCIKGSLDRGISAEMANLGTKVVVSTFNSGAPASIAFNLAVFGSPRTLIP
jgi:hypothetical protein